jgi:hypothetical protein
MIDEPRPSDESEQASHIPIRSTVVIMLCMHHCGIGDVLVLMFRSLAFDLRFSTGRTFAAIAQNS